MRPFDLLVVLCGVGVAVVAHYLKEPMLYMAAGGLVGWRIPTGNAPVSPAVPRTPSGGFFVLPLAWWVAIVGVVALSALASRIAKADCASPAPMVVKCDKLTLQPSFAAGWQLNLRNALDGDYGHAAYRFAGMAGYGATYHGEKITAGGGVYVGVGLSAFQPNAPQANILGTIFDRYGLGIGVQRVPFAGGHVYQGLATLVLNYSAGATTTTFLDALKGFAQACVGELCGI